MIITSLQGIDVRVFHACCGEQLESVVLVQTEANSLLIEIYGSVCYCYMELYSAATNCRKILYIHGSVHRRSILIRSSNMQQM